jgi:hypothetical protein
VRYPVSEAHALPFDGKPVLEEFIAIGEDLSLKGSAPALHTDERCRRMHVHALTEEEHE